MYEAPKDSNAATAPNSTRDKSERQEKVVMKGKASPSYIVVLPFPGKLGRGSGDRSMFGERRRQPTFRLGTSMHLGPRASSYGEPVKDPGVSD